jgi:hypothetical protein
VPRKNYQLPRLLVALASLISSRVGVGINSGSQKNNDFQFVCSNTAVGCLRASMSFIAVRNGVTASVAVCHAWLKTSSIDAHP